MFTEFKKEIDWGGRRLVLETGKMARQADGAVLATYGETTVLCTAVGESQPRPGIDFSRSPLIIRKRPLLLARFPADFSSARAGLAKKRR